jgi:hypothetical protein
MNDRCRLGGPEALEAAEVGVLAVGEQAATQRPIGIALSMKALWSGGV